MVSLSPQQADALTKVRAWLKSRKQVFRLDGYAGTGKTTIAKVLAQEAPGKVEFAAFTGKAASVLAAKGCTNARTIHSLIYRAKEDRRRPGEMHFELNRSSDAGRARLVIVDEVSMVNEQLGKDLLGFGAQVLAIGDPAQLPPVEGGGFFHRGEPDVLLTEIHRQAADNPILDLATKARQDEWIRLGTYGSSRVCKRVEITDNDVLRASIVICGVNNRRRALNRQIRKLRGCTSDLPVSGDRLICLRNNHALGALNGTMWDYVEGELIRGHVRHEHTLTCTLRSEDDPSHVITANIPAGYFTAETQAELDEVKAAHPRLTPFDYGYAITCHKAQGSQWKHPLIFDDSFVFKDDAARWRYTAITRAVERVTLVK